MCFVLFLHRASISKFAWRYKVIGWHILDRNEHVVMTGYDLDFLLDCMDGTMVRI